MVLACFYTEQVEKFIIIKWNICSYVSLLSHFIKSPTHKECHQRLFYFSNLCQFIRCIITCQLHHIELCFLNANFHNKKDEFHFPLFIKTKELKRASFKMHKHMHNAHTQTVVTARKRMKNEREIFHLAGIRYNTYTKKCLMAHEFFGLYA